MNALIALVAVLGAAGVWPALAVAGRSLVVLFLAPLIGAAVAAVAVLIELAAGGLLPINYAVVAAIVNLAVLAWWRPAGRSRPQRAGLPRGWSLAAVAVMAGCLAVPLQALRSPAIGWDANTMWLTKALMMYGGHHALLTGLQNPAYQYSNPDYPPLTSAAGALAFTLFGLSDLHLFVDVTTLLNACALGVVGAGIAAAGIGTGAAARVKIHGVTHAGSGRWPARAAAVAAAGAICLVGFAVSGQWGVVGYADLLWAAAAAGAVIWGLVVPPSTQALGIAWVCAVVASLTKNEGLTTALVILVLIALRYRPLTLAGPKLRTWAERGVLAAVPALPGLAWAGFIRLLGIHDNFFLATTTESPVTRAQATIAGLAAHLAVAPVALAVLLAGCWLLRGDRERARLGNPVWLWLSCLGSLTIIFGTYVFGGDEIHWWLANSVDRTTIFAQLLLYSDLAIWLVIALDRAFTRPWARDGQGIPSRGRHALEAPAPPGEPVAAARRRNGPWC
jgi:hypothetical protein